MTRHLLLLSIALAAGCMKRSDRYCATHDDPRCGQDSPDASLSCTDDGGCAMLAATPFCDVPNMTCVECRDSNDCRLGEPVCGADKSCHGCTLHSECASDACLPDGTCGTSETVAYVDDNNGNSGPCSVSSPCDSVASALVTGKPYIKIAGDLKEAVSIASGTVTLLAAPGARLREDNGVILEVRGTAQVQVFDLTIGNPSMTNATSVSMPAGTTGSLELHRVRVEHSSATSGAINIAAGTFALHRSTVIANLGGGLIIGAGARFTVRDNFIVENGKGALPGTTTNGGVVISGSDSVPSYFEYNTVATNGSSGAVYRGGATCIGTAVSAIGNIFYGNSETNMTTDATQVGGTCVLGNSYIRGLVAGNLGFDLVSTPADYHVGPAATEVVDVAGDCSASTTTDIDGEDRPYGTQCDLGADEYHPQ